MLEWLFGSGDAGRGLADDDTANFLELGLNKDQRLIRLVFREPTEGVMMQPHQAKALGKSLVAAAEVLEELDEQNDQAQRG